MSQAATAAVWPVTTDHDYTSWLPDPTTGSVRFDRPLPEDQRGKCLVCGAGFIEHVACQSGDCHFVRLIEEGPD